VTLQYTDKEAFAKKYNLWSTYCKRTHSRLSVTD